MSNANLGFNPVVKEMPEASSIFVNQLIYNCKRAGQDITTLSLGEAFFQIPNFDFAKLDLEKSHHYSESLGLPELRKKLADYHLSRYATRVDPSSEIIVSAGSKALIYMAMLTAAGAGDEILIHEPAWLSYPEQARLIGAVPKFIPFDVPSERFVEYFTPRTRILVICNPNNPAGHVYSAEDLKALYQACLERGVYLLVDEAYSEFTTERFTSIGGISTDKSAMILVNSLSKNLGLSGWRIGYVIASAEFVAQMLKVNQHLITCAPTLLQMYCAQYFDDLLQATLPQVRLVVEKRRRIAKMLGEVKLDYLDGESTFYFFVSIGNFPGTSEEFAMNLLIKKQIGVVPGSAYGRSTDRFIRISIGTETETRIFEALSAIKQMTMVNLFDRDELAVQIQQLSRSVPASSQGENR